MAINQVDGKHLWDRDDWLNLFKSALAALLFMGYLAIVAASLVIAVPPTSENIVLQGLAVLGPIIGVIASNMWPKGNDTDRNTIQSLVDKVPPTSGQMTPKEAYNIVGPIVEEAVNGSQQV